MTGTTKKIVSILMILAMAVLFCGCGGSGGSDKDAFVGTWNATMDVTEFFNSTIQESIAQGDDDMASYFNIDKFELPLVFTFNEDDTYTMTADKDGLSSTMDAVKSNIKDGFMKYLEDMVADQGLDMSVDEVLQLMGYDLDELIEEAIGSELVDAMVAEIETSGKWEVKGGKLNMTDSMSDTEMGEFGSYKIDSNGITLNLTEDEEGSLEQLGVSTLVLTKA